MQPGQRIARLGVIELRLARLADIDALPVHETVALHTVRTEAALVLVFVATDATRRESKIRPAGILDLDGCAFLGRDAGRIVTLITAQALVLALQQVSRIFVVEGLDVPLDQREVFSVVLRVAAGAFLTGTGRDVIGGMQPLARREPGSDFGVTVQTLQRRLPAKLVATGAVGGSVQRLVRPRQGSGRFVPRPAPTKQNTRARTTERRSATTSERRSSNCTLQPGSQASIDVLLSVLSCPAPGPSRMSKRTFVTTANDLQSRCQ
jgi:hypothetical protein